MKTPYVYVIIRTDIPIEQQIVQSCHAALESGFSFERPDQTCHLVLCMIESEDKLLKLGSKLEQAGIDFEFFHEPWWDMGYSALATKPIFEEKERKLLKKLKLWEMIPNANK